ncbi:MAG: PilT/PilU family type 4a pilus ATPase [Ruminococcus sp.]|nr:PilT/PilU family type 4a pilus ATPase [Ruminococcus sp.]MCM1381260.1 PilT/PilU family type 4a pilus ATPase [Muribaculaceae bacterium]MCM1478611.1 PilT/PilU family type 4a pilus ATPase [Muribaculaceae bacterium]
MDIKQILVDAVKKDASDIFIISGASLAYKIDNRVVPADGAPLMPADTKAAVYEIFSLAGIDIGSPDDLKSEMDFSFSIAGTGRFRANIYRQRGSFSAVLRCVPFELPDSQKLGIPDGVMNLADTKSGIVLVTGAAGNGKSTTLSCIIDRINSTSEGHIITIEDPIEFLHKHKKCIISQREINIDTDSYVNALRAALRQAPNVILVGEMRDFETINIAMTAAETGQLVLSTLHTNGAANTVDRIIDVFPTNQQHQIRVQLSMVLRAVVTQQLVPAVGGGLVPAFEIMNVNSAIRTMIREQKTHQIETILQSEAGMQTMDSALVKLYKDGIISAETAVEYAYNPELMAKRV